VNVTVTDPAGNSISPDINGILNAYYEETNDENGQPIDQITILTPLQGDYQISVTRETEATDGDLFDLKTQASGQEPVLLARETPVPADGQALSYDYDYLPWLAGDASGDELIDLGDAIFLLNYLFRDDSPPTPFLAGDSDSDGSVTLGDVIHLLNYLFRSGPPPGY
jgi:hypothetical protein